ncbi:transcription antiterminator [Pelosinus sp. UFO1]|uniref:BglG family transcription antiterminator n=1 Tax=Pelosinus sp. UFO1 TaxID=484770 RepID=UPI003526D20A
MILTFRCRQILKKIIDAKRSFKIKDLADEFHVSTRTIKYDLENVRLWLEKQKEQVVQLESKPNLGIWLEGEITAINKIRSMLDNEAGVALLLNQEERSKYIALELLINEKFVTINLLAEKMGVSRNTVVADMQRVERLLQNWRIEMERKVHYGIRAVSSEVNRRLALEYVVQSFLNSNEISYILHSIAREYEFPSRVGNVITTFLLEKDQLKIVCQAIGRIAANIKKVGEQYLSDRMLIGALIRFCVVIQRIKTNNGLTAFDTTVAIQAKEHPFYSIFSEECAALANHLGTEISDTEIGFIWLQSLGNGMYHNELHHNGYKQPVVTGITAEIISKVSQCLKVTYTDDTELFDSLLAHLTDKLAKYEYGVIDPNPLVAEVIQSYPEMFRCVKEVCSEVFAEISVFLTDPDLAYIVLHFQAAYERRYGRSQFRAIVVCGTGRGTARLLKTRLENEIKSLSVLGYCSVLEIEQVLKMQPIDLVISVLPINTECPLVVVNSILTQRDIVAIHKVLKKICGTQLEYTQETPEKKHDFSESFMLMIRNINVTELPFVESISQDIISKGFQLGMLITSEFKEYLSEQAAAGLMLHSLLMVNRLAFGSPYVDFNYSDQPESKRLAELRCKLINVLGEEYRSIPKSEISAILRYFS